MASKAQPPILLGVTIFGEFGAPYPHTDRSLWPRHTRLDRVSMASKAQPPIQSVVTMLRGVQRKPCPPAYSAR